MEPNYFYILDQPWFMETYHPDYVYLTFNTLLLFNIGIRHLTIGCHGSKWCIHRASVWMHSFNQDDLDFSWWVRFHYTVGTKHGLGKIRITLADEVSNTVMGDVINYTSS